MLAGIAAYVKRVRPGVKVVGVEAIDAADMTTSLERGRVVTLDSVGLILTERPSSRSATKSFECVAS